MADQLVMYDSALNASFPHGGYAYAAYVDGAIGDQPNYGHITRAFPAARHLSIAVFPAGDADALDMEAGAASPQDFPAWHARQVKRGAGRPVAYASAGLMKSGVLPALTAAGIPLAAVRLWTAHYADPHLCGPGTCGLLPVDADATQYTPRALGRTLDESLLTSGFFPTPAPASPVEDIMTAIPEVRKGSTNRQAVANWQALLVAQNVAHHRFELGNSGPKRDGIDGVFGDLTDKATWAFQKAKGIHQDGIAGLETYKAALA